MKKLTFLVLAFIAGIAFLTLSQTNDASTPKTRPAKLHPASTTGPASQPQAEEAKETADGSWGHLTGQIVLTGTAPENPVENVGNNPDKAICLVDGEVPQDDGIVVSEDGGLRDVFVMMYIARGDEDPTFHPDYEAAKEIAVVVDNHNCRFVPHAASVRPGQTITLKNSDAVGHNCHLISLKNEFNQNVPPNSTLDVTCEESDSAPGELKCDIHGWMDGVVLVRENPYVSISDADGKFTIENIPAGDWEFQFWHKKVGYLKTLKVDGKDPGRRGEVELAIGDGETLDLGTLELAAEVFED